MAYERRGKSSESPSGRDNFTHLPDEVLVRILKLVQRPPDGHNRVVNTPAHWQWTPPDPNWTRMLLVCKYICELAQHTPELWSTIDCSWSPIRRRFLQERAQDAPLTIRAVYHHFDRGKAVTLAETWKNTCAAFIVVKDDVDLDVPVHCLEGMLRTGAPKLQCLEYVEGPELIVVDGRFLGGSCTTLAKLSLHHVLITDAPQLPGVRHVHLSCIVVDPKLHGLLRFLTHMPNLENLTIERIKPRERLIVEPVPSTSRPAYLPFLRSLKIEDSVKAASVILHCFSNPSTELVVNTSLSDDPPTWTASMHDSHVGLLRRMFTFWQAVAGETELPDGQLTVVNAGRQAISRTITFGTAPDGDLLGPRLFYRSACTLDRIPYLSDVKTLRVAVATGNIGHVLDDVERLVGLRKLSLGDCTGVEHWGKLYTLLEKRDAEGNPLMLEGIPGSRIAPTPVLSRRDRRRWRSELTAGVVTHK